jgi:hypothetical protein
LSERGGERVSVLELAKSAPPGIVGYKDNATADADEEEMKRSTVRRSVQEILDYQSSASEDVPEALPWPCPLCCQMALLRSSASQEFPFSIPKPPPTDIPDEQLLAVSPPLNNYHRLRGNSISAMSTDGSANPQLSWGNMTTMSADSRGITTPATFPLTVPASIISSPTSIPCNLLVPEEKTTPATCPVTELFVGPLMANRKHDPATRHQTSANKITGTCFSAEDGSQSASATNTMSSRGHELKSRFGIKKP